MQSPPPHFCLSPTVPFIPSLTTPLYLPPLSPQLHEDRDKGVYISGMSEFVVTAPEQVSNILRIAAASRAVASTAQNAASSRSHSIFILTLTQRHAVSGHITVSRLYLVDLAGSESVGKSGAKGLQLKESAAINKSLTSLGKVIHSLTDGVSTHIPYRESKVCTG